MTRCWHVLCGSVCVFISKGLLLLCPLCEVILAPLCCVSPAVEKQPSCSYHGEECVLAFLWTMLDHFLDQVQPVAVHTVFGAC